MKSIIITGASSGIGEVTARLLASKGYNLALAARSTDKLEELKSELEKAGAKVIAVKTDVTKRSEVKELAKKTIEAFGTIDVLVNNAGIMPLSFLKNLHEDEWEQTIDVNIKGVLNGIGAVLPKMMENKKGHIINVSSVAGVKVYPTSSVYCGTKWAVEAITEGVRQELGKEFNIRTTSIRPGATKSNLVSTITDQEVMKWFESWGEFEFLETDVIANSILYAIEQPDNVSISEILIRPTDQII
jgi:NADP-dependent 3-hydroxy acid dehydrogenase YdfG